MPFPIKNSSEDLGIKIGSPEMAAWQEVIDAQKTAIINSEINSVVAKEVLRIAEERYEQERIIFGGK